MRVALDTNRYTDFYTPLDATVKIVEEADSVFLPFIVVGELRGGFTYGSRQVENETALRRFLSKPGVSILFADEQTTHHYAGIYRQLRRQGTPIPMNDMWLAALVVQHNLTLHARDRHFDHLPQLLRI